MPSAYEGSTTMTIEQTNTLVLKDHAGSYYLVSQEMLEGSRVPGERNAELEQLIAAAAQDGDDVQGHHPVAYGVGAFAVFYWGASMSYQVTRYFLPQEQVVPK